MAVHRRFCGQSTEGVPCVSVFIVAIRSIDRRPMALLLAAADPHIGQPESCPASPMYRYLIKPIGP